MKTKTILTGLIVAALVLILANRGFAFQNESDGFRGLKWGDPPSKKMKKRRSINPDFIWYQRTGDKFKIGRAELDSIYYAFYKGQFFLVEITVKADPSEITHYDYLKDVLILKFGRGKQEGEYIIRWDGETTTIILGNWGGLLGKLSICSTEIWLQKQDDERNDVREGAEQGLADF